MPGYHDLVAKSQTHLVPTLKPGSLIFYDASQAVIIRIEPDGEIYWRERLITKDANLVAALRDLVMK